MNADDGVRVWPGVAVTMAAFTVFGCAPLNPPAQRAGEDPFDVIYSAPHATASPAGRVTRNLTASAYRARLFFLVPRVVPRAMPLMDKIHPQLRQWMGTRSATDVEELFVSFRDTVLIPRFPKADVTRPRNDPVNEQRVNQAKALIESLMVHRQAQYDVDSLVLAAHQAQIVQTYWIMQGAVVRMPLGRVDSLSRQSSVLYIRPNVGDGPPHHDANDYNDPLAARESIGTKHYSDLGLRGGWIALLDTGVRTSHTMLCSSTLCLVANCETGGCATPYPNTSSCMTYTGPCPPDAGGDMDVSGHGTSSAAILVGNANLGDKLKGVTTASLDCFTVYGSDNKVRVGASVKGFEHAIARLNQVIVAEMQDNTATDIADVSAAAGHAYQAGAMVIAANGNYAYWGSGEPARSRRAIGVGAYYFQGEIDLPYAWGLTIDERVKPDLKAPTYTETASNGGDDRTQYFGGTSGATPYAAGAAGLLRDWMIVGNSGMDPGQVYAHLLLSGDKSSPFDATSSAGAGMIELPETGKSWWGKVWISNNVEFVEIPAEITDTGNMKVRAVIWWPEGPAFSGNMPIDGHNDIDFQLRGPGGLKVDAESRVGVFEIAEWTGVARGSWKLKVSPITMRRQPQVVYWAFSAVPAP
ncbi:MAG TPA: S8/S53 family peptidase [Candidatus Eisenbacteria bacterium]|nr:S8/S53 family peptidase [Candidatus Eisenbacteria bacterium]